MEGMADAEGKPADCVHPEPGIAETAVAGAYSPSLNPFVYFHSLLDLGDCVSSDVPFTELEQDLQKVERFRLGRPVLAVALVISLAGVTLFWTIARRIV